jgi:DNA modification methylase
LEQHDLLLTDPPYGIGENSKKSSRGISTAKWKRGRVTDYGEFSWDTAIDQGLLDLCISKANSSIIFGGNYYQLPPSSCWLVWDKLTSGDFADCELAWTNMRQAVRRIVHLWSGFKKEIPEQRFHPTQKPLRVMAWCIEQAGEISTILDPFAGSGTTLLAAKLRNIKSTGIEREERYCEITAKRLSQEVLNFAKA